MNQYESYSIPIWHTRFLKGVLQQKMIITFWGNFQDSRMISKIHTSMLHPQGLTASENSWKMLGKEDLDAFPIGFR